MEVGEALLSGGDEIADGGDGEHARDADGGVEPRRHHLCQCGPAVAAGDHLADGRAAHLRGEGGEEAEPQRHLPSGGVAGEKDGAEVEPRRRCAGRAILTASPVQRGHLVDRGEDVELRAREAAAAHGVCRIILRHPGVFYAQRRDGSEWRHCLNLGGRRREGGQEGGGAGRLAGPLWLPEAAVEVDEEREGAVARRDVKDRVVCLVERDVRCAAARGGG
mmetsp:Transcript_20969/g.66951  ORF Transcript_20969/g.66951 Transcript_20969/m.66951 type:complete len:220 (+) Transcript_20969:715-1374(+)